MPNKRKRASADVRREPNVVWKELLYTFKTCAETPLLSILHQLQTPDPSFAQYLVNAGFVQSIECMGVREHVHIPTLRILISVFTELLYHEPVMNIYCAHVCLTFLKRCIDRCQRMRTVVCELLESAMLVTTASIEEVEKEYWRGLMRSLFALLHVYRKDYDVFGKVMRVIVLLGEHQQIFVHHVTFCEHNLLSTLQLMGMMGACASAVGYSNVVADVLYVFITSLVHPDTVGAAVNHLLNVGMQEQLLEYLEQCARGCFYNSTLMSMVATSASVIVPYCHTHILEVSRIFELLVHPYAAT